MQNRCSLLALWIGALVLAQPGQAQKHPFQPLIGSPLSTYASASVSALWGDYDGDDDLDLLVGDAFGPDELFTNNGDGTFTLSEIQFSVVGEINNGVWADFNNDGDLEFVSGSLESSSYWINLGGGSLVYRPSILDQYRDVRDVNVADIDRDGLLELFILRRDNLVNVLLKPEARDFAPWSSGDFGQQLDTANTACMADYNADGFQDVYVVTSAGEHNEFFRNEAGVLVAILESEAVADVFASVSCAWADYDGDGDFDLFVANANGIPNQLFRNDAGILIGVAEGPVVEEENDTFNLSWGDIDNDADLDLVVVNRYESARLYENDGSGIFSSIPLYSAYTSGVWIVSPTLTDYDEDGDLDLFVAAGNSDAFERNRLYVNTTNASANWLQIRLHGIESNRFGVGARIEAHATIGGVPRKQVRELQAHSGRRSSGGLRAHFGLADASAVDSLIISWQSGIRQVVENPGINAIVEIIEPMPTSIAPSGPASPIAALSIYPNPARHRVAIEVQNAETGLVKMELFDVRGRRVWWFVQVAEAGELVRRMWPEGSRDVSPGIYTLRVHSGGDVFGRRLTILR